MARLSTTLLQIFAAIIGLAILSVIVSRKSRAPEAIAAFSTGLANVVAAAVDPKYTANNGNNAGAFATPASDSQYGLPHLWSTVTN